MTCHYCNNFGVVGGTMPWPNGTSHANPCAYCKSSPVLKFKPGVTPFTGSIMPVPDVHKDTPGFSTYAEPELSGQRVIVVIDPKCRMWCWGETGKFEMHEGLVAELAVLATQAMFDGFGNEYACGVAIEGVVHKDTLAIYMLVPLIALLDGKDTKPLGVRRHDLDQTVASVGEGIFYSLVPRVMVHVSERVKPANLDAACDALGVDRIMVKQTLGFWGIEPCWSRYVREEDF